MKNIPFSFPITVFESAEEKVSPTITKKRCAIFYKGENRNGGYITEEFAERLISTLPYAPIKGIYDDVEEDFGNHGKARNEGRVYGVVPEQFNFAWEKRLDADGVEREYACADVYLFTALYEEANEIAGKGQSMELYGPSIRGSWVDIEGKILYKYSDACFLGLQVLGDNAIPCFQGSSFFSLEEQQIYSLLTTLLEKFDQLSIGGNTQMENNDTLTFALSDNQKQNAIFKALNPEVIRYFVMDSYEDYALVFDMETEKVMKVGYTKDESDNIIIAEEFVEMVAEYVTKEEKEVLDGLRSKTESTSFEALSKVFEENEKTIADLKVEVDNKDVEISTLKTDKENLVKDNTDMADAISGFVAKTEQLESDVATLNTLNSELQSFKDKVEKAEKEAVITKYSAKLDAATIESFTAKIDEYSIHDLKKDLAFALVEGNESLFAEKPAVPAYVPSEQNLTGLEALLSKYKK